MFTLFVEVALHFLQKGLYQAQVKILNGGLMINPVIKGNAGGKFIQSQEIFVPGNNTPGSITDVRLALGSFTLGTRRRIGPVVARRAPEDNDVLTG